MDVCSDHTRLDTASACSHLYNEEFEQVVGEYSHEEPIKPPLEPETSSSQFGEESCGEPQSAQHLLIDFTHGELDNEFVQKKCCAFWEMIESHPEIHHMMVMPDSEIFGSSPSSSEATTPPEDVFPSELEEEPVIKEHTAVSMLDLASRKGLIDKSFEAKIPQTFCPLGDREYQENEPTQPKPPQKKKEKCLASSSSRHKKKKSSDVSVSPEKVKNLCDIMKKWDLQHPKSMEPPGHALPLIHSVMQRKVS